MSLFRRKRAPRLADRPAEPDGTNRRYDVLGTDDGRVIEIEIEFIHCPGCPDCQAALDRLMAQPQIQALVRRYTAQQASGLDAELAALIEREGKQ